MIKTLKTTTDKPVVPRKPVIPIIQPSAEEYQTSLFYGLSGTGKTTLAATMPKPILFVDTKEKGYQSIIGIPDIDVTPVGNWDQLIKVKDFIEADDKYRTVIFDTVTGVQDLRIAKQTGGEMSLTFGSLSQREFGAIAGDIKTLIFDMKELDNKHVVYLAHIRTFGSEEGESEDLSPERNARLMPSVVSTLNGACDVIGNTFITMETVRKKEKVGNRTVTKTARRFDYCLRLGPNPTYVTKIRTPSTVIIPSFIRNPSWDKIEQLMKGTKDGTTRKA